MRKMKESRYATEALIAKFLLTLVARLSSLLPRVGLGRLVEVSASAGEAEARSAFDVDEGRVEGAGVLSPCSAAFSAGVRLRILRIDGSAIDNYPGVD